MLTTDRDGTPGKKFRDNRHLVPSQVVPLADYRQKWHVKQEIQRLRAKKGRYFALLTGKQAFQRKNAIISLSEQKRVRKHCFFTRLHFKQKKAVISPAASNKYVSWPTRIFLAGHILLSFAQSDKHHLRHTRFRPAAEGAFVAFERIDGIENKTVIRQSLSRGGTCRNAVFTTICSTSRYATITAIRSTYPNTITIIRSPG